MKSILSKAVVLILAPFMILESEAEEMKTIRVFSVICDAYPGEAGAINQGVKADGFLINDIMKEQISVQGWGARLEMVELRGVEATKAQLQQRFSTFCKSVKPDDTVFVYFSGHGVILDRGTNDIQLQTCDQALISRKGLSDQIDGLNCRLKIFITDCCSSFSRKEVAEGDDIIKPWSTIYFLLLRHEGFVNITAASPGEEAYATNVGSFLTVNLHSDMQRYKTWDRVFSETRKRVVKETREDAPRQQTPLAYSMAKPVKELASGNDALPAEAGFVIPDSHKRQLTRKELENMGLQQLYLARNEIAARHGYYFKTPMLYTYFSSLAWYESNSENKSYSLSTLEAKNALLIREIEVENGGPFIGAARIPDSVSAIKETPDIFSYSSNRALSRSVVESLTLPQLSIARNEIYARHGYPFKGTFLSRYFSKKSYYRRIERATNPKFNDVETLNIWLLKKVERIKGGPHQW